MVVVFLIVVTGIAGMFLRHSAAVQNQELLATYVSPEEKHLNKEHLEQRLNQIEKRLALEGTSLKARLIELEKRQAGGESVNNSESGEYELPFEDQQVTQFDAGQLLEQAAKDREEEIRVLEHTFDQETRDDIWANAYEEQLTAAIDRAFPGVLKDVGCKTSLCSLQVEHDTPQQQEMFSRNSSFVILDAAAAHFVVRELPGGRWVTHIHVVRKEHEPPSLAQEDLTRHRTGR